MCEARLDAEREMVRVAQEFSLDAFTILEAVRDDVGTIVDFRWTYVNPAAVTILKHSREELVGHQLLSVLPGNKQNSELFERYVKVVETGQPHKLELRYDGEGIQGWFRNMAVKLDDGVAVFFADITARKQYEQQLVYEAFLLANMSDAVMAVDRDFNITRAGTRGQRRCTAGRRRRYWGGRSPTSCKRLQHQRCGRPRSAAAEGETPRTFYVLHHNRQGQQVYGDAVMRARCVTARAISRAMWSSTTT